VDELRQKFNSDYTEKVQTLELSTKALKEDLRKKDAKVAELINEAIKI
jgi:hypothetical protein